MTLLGRSTDLGWVNYQVLRRCAVTLLNATGADGTIVVAQCGHRVDTSTSVLQQSRPGPTTRGGANAR